MISAYDALVGFSSLGIRILGYVFLRWIPGHPFPPLIIALFATYAGLTLGGISQSVVKSRQRHARDPGSARENAVRPGPLRSTTSKDGGSSRILRTMLSGIPHSSCRAASTITILVNILISVMVVDLTWSPTWFYPSHDLAFARLGFVSHDSVKILVREPQSAVPSVAMSYRLLPDVLPDDPSRGWTLVETTTSLNVANDFTAAFTINSLLPDTSYQYNTTNQFSGTFKTGPAPGQYPSNSDSFTFLHSSCIVPNFPYVPFRHHLSFPGFAYLSELLPSLNAKFMLFLGDFIYVDVPRRFGNDRETYRREYRQVYASPDWPSVSSPSTLNTSLPWIHVYDDHEIANDWDKNETGVYPSAADPFTHYQASVNPPVVRPNVSYFSFTQGPASFFLMDTRRYRTPFDGTDGKWTNESLPLDERKSMLGPQQRDDFLVWLSRKEPAGVKWKIVVSSIPFTKNWRFGSEDTWAGYLGERQVLLQSMWTSSRDNGYGVIVLSGDRHEFAATKFPPPRTGEDQDMWPEDVAVHEFSASPLSMFYLPVRTYRQEDDEDVMLKYLPDGNSKFGAVSIGRDGGVDYKLYIDGKQAWEYRVELPKRGAERSWKFW
ncbi:hypothetical protein CAC42_249 [Sphaceloma murrayae]|uniref:PhoD-like phosphatase metallophosphatase domain-containing protein n=1 Tax=Sphaceloma murrayae TaxID=2082308 RepID=A0A2K1QN13_9PEZI|nr:hypothetical protein CAC42_249 [Sphaceloma murrayae]